MRRLWLLLALLASPFGRAADNSPLELETKIPLGDVHGRIDHMAMDSGRARLLLAELGNDSVGVVDVKERRTSRTLTGLKEPQGIGYVASTDTVYVASAGDGTVRLYQGPDLAPICQLVLGEDADNIRVDEASHRVFVGYGNGSIAVIDAATRKKIADIPVKGHPESFQLDSASTKIYLNIPDTHQIAIIDRALGKQIASWSTGLDFSNYPMALDTARGEVITVFRHPASVGVFAAPSGRAISSVNTCGDSDDVFIDAKRERLYVSCGEGFIDVLARQGALYKSISRVATASGARTAFFAPSLDRLFVAVRAGSESSASIWVYRPIP